MTDPMVSIVIPVYNGANYLACAIESALNQTYPHCETIIVNDGSTDDGETERIALSYGDRIRYFAKENGGVASALNLGIRQMRGDYFSWLSHDDYYLPDKVLRELQTIPAGHPDTLIYGDYVFYDTITGHRLAVVMEKWFTQRQLSTPLFPVMFQLIHGCALLIHRSHFDRVGLFDEAQRNTQDYDMWFRVFRGASIRHCPHSEMISRLHPQAGNQTIPEFIDDACAFLLRADRQLTDAERAEMSGTPHRYYRQMYENLASTKYAAAKRYFSAAAAQDKYGCHCRDPEEKKALLGMLEANCGREPAAMSGASLTEAALDAQIRQAMERYYQMPENRFERHIHRPRWGLGTRIRRALLKYGWKGTLQKGLEKNFPKSRAIP
jgi:glycosyltransferase involved in cell wall biosynthesis